MAKLGNLTINIRPRTGGPKGPVRPPEPDYLLIDADDRDRARMHRRWHDEHPWRPCERPYQPLEVLGWRNTIRRFLRV